MIKGISYWSVRDGLANTHPIADAAAEAAAEGFQTMELSLGAEGVLHVGTTQAECEVIRQTVEAAGLVVETTACGLSWGTNPIANDAATRENAVLQHAAALERTAWLGAKAMLMVPGVVRSPISPGQTVRYDRAVQRCRENTVRLLDTAERMEVDLCLENVWNGLFYSPLELVQFLDDIDHPNLGVYFDVGNVLGYQQYPPHWIELLGKRIKRVHLKDYAEKFDWVGSYDFCDLLSGDMPWSETMAALRAIGYDKTLVAEMLPWKEGLLTRTSSAMDQIMRM